MKILWYWIKTLWNSAQ